jgi:hypothetical protein
MRQAQVVSRIVDSSQFCSKWKWEEDSMKPIVKRKCLVSLDRLEDRSLPSTLPVLPLHAPLLSHLASTAPVVSSTAASNGDQNPYGVAIVPVGIPGHGQLHKGDVLVSDFNDATKAGPPASGNVQGTGTSIVRITPRGHTSTFFQGKPPLGLTTALGILPGGFVLVGSTPSHTDASGTTTITGPGSLLLLNRDGHLVKTLVSGKLLDGPWDLTVHAKGNRAQVFVSNVVSGTVTRLDILVPNRGTAVPVLLSQTQIASGYGHGADPAAAIVGPTGLAYDAAKNVLYVAATKDNKIYAIHDAGTRATDAGKGQLVVKDNKHLHGPLGLVLAPQGDLIVANGDAPSVHPPAMGQQNELLEYTPQGKFVAQFQLDPGPPGAAFGLALETNGHKLRFAAVNDNANAVDVWTFRLK